MRNTSNPEEADNRTTQQTSGHDTLRALAASLEKITGPSAAGEIFHLYSSGFFNDNELWGLVMDQGRRFGSVNIDGVTEPFTAQDFDAELRKPGTFALLFRDRRPEGDVLESFCILRRLDGGASLAETLRAEFGDKTAITADDEMMGRIEKAHRNGVLSSLVEMHSRRAQLTVATFLRIARELPEDAILLTKMLHAMTPGENHRKTKSTGNGPALDTAKKFGFEFCGLTKGLRKVTLPPDSPFREDLLENEAHDPANPLDITFHLQFGVYAAETRNFLDILKDREKQRSFERTVKEQTASEPKRMTRRTLLVLLGGSSLLAGGGGLALRHLLQENPRAPEPSRVAPDAASILRLVFPGRVFSELSLERYAACPNRDAQRAYLMDTFLRVTSEASEKETYVFPSDGRAFCELSKLRTGHLAYLRIIRPLENDSTLAIHIVMDFGSDSPRIHEYPANAHSVSIRVPGKQKEVQRIINFDLLRRIRNDDALRQLLTLNASAMPWDELVRKLSVYSEHFPQQFSLQQTFWRSIVEDNVNHRQHINDLHLPGE